jgi:hypothetical protein
VFAADGTKLCPVANLFVGALFQLDGWLALRREELASRCEGLARSYEELFRALLVKAAPPAVRTPQRRSAARRFSRAPAPSIFSLADL